MAWVGTFTFEGDMSDQLQRVRSLIGDIDSSSVKLWDQQITPFLAGGIMAQANDYYAAAMAADLIDAQSGSGVASLSAGGTSVTFNTKPGTYADLAKRLRLMGAKSGSASPFVGGTSRADIAARNADTDRPARAFARDLGEVRGVVATTWAGCE